MSKSARMPVLFLSHGSPTLPFDEIPARDFMVRLGGQLPQPRAIVVVSAHWEAEVPSITGSASPATIHDFHGFPPALYELSYEVPGDPELAARIADILKAGGFSPLVSPDRGLDHGAWNPLMLIYPQSSIPVLQLSLMLRRAPSEHVALGRLLAPLRDEGVLIIGSGGAVHNLRALDWNGRGNVPGWAAGFEHWLVTEIEAGAIGALTAYRQTAHDAAIAHPSEEHIMPLFVALGAAAGEEPTAKGHCIHRSFTFGSLSMACFMWSD